MCECAFTVAWKAICSTFVWWIATSSSTSLWKAAWGGPAPLACAEPLCTSVPNAAVLLRRVEPVAASLCAGAGSLFLHPASFQFCWAVRSKWLQQPGIAFPPWCRSSVSSLVTARTASAALHTPRRQLTGLLQHQCSSRLQTLLGKPMFAIPGCRFLLLQLSCWYA